MYYRGPGLLDGRMIRLLAHPLPPPSPANKFDRRRRLWKRDNLSIKRIGGKGVVVKPPNHSIRRYDRKKAWCSRNHSILSGKNNENRLAFLWPLVLQGDLNYRKLVGDLNWEATVPFRTALQVPHSRRIQSYFFFYRTPWRVYELHVLCCWASTYSCGFPLVYIFSLVTDGLSPDVWFLV